MAWTIGPITEAPKLLTGIPDGKSITAPVIIIAEPHGNITVSPNRDVGIPEFNSIISPDTTIPVAGNGPGPAGGTGQKQVPNAVSPILVTNIFFSF
jgi:hypothetical protein